MTKTLKRISFTPAFIHALAVKARDAQDVPGGVAIRLLNVLKIDLDDHLRLDLDIAPAHRDDFGFESGGQVFQRPFRKAIADFTDYLELIFFRTATIKLDSNPRRRPEPQMPPTMTTSRVPQDPLRFAFCTTDSVIGMCESGKFMMIAHSLLTSFCRPC